MSGESDSQETVYVSITPCRLIDTRPASDLNVGPRNAPLPEDTDLLFNAWSTADDNSPCAIPTTAAAISTNTAAVTATDSPVMSYYDIGSSDLKISICSNPTCGTVVRRTLDSAGIAGQTTALAIRDDGTPIISYYDTTNTDLEVAACEDASCASTTISVVDASGDVGSMWSITIGRDGHPVISYHDRTNGDLRLVSTDTSASGVAIPITSRRGEHHDRISTLLRVTEAWPSTSIDNPPPFGSNAGCSTVSLMSGRPGYDELIAERGRDVADQIVASAELYSDNAHEPWSNALRWAIEQHDRPVDPKLVAQQQENARRYDELVTRRNDDSRPILYLADQLGGDAFEYPAQLMRAEAIFDARGSQLGPGASMREQLDWARAMAEVAAKDED